MFGLAMSTILTHAAALLAGGVGGTWLHTKWLAFKVKAAAEEASIKDRVAALEAYAKAPPKV